MDAHTRQETSVEVVIDNVPLLVSCFLIGDPDRRCDNKFCQQDSESFSKVCGERIKKYIFAFQQIMPPAASALSKFTSFVLEASSNCILY